MDAAILTLIEPVDTAHREGAAPSGSHEPSDAQYGGAIVRGLILGWVFVPLIVAAMAFVGAPDAGWAFWLGTGAVVGFWCGLFLGGVFSLSVFQLDYERTAAAAASVAGGSGVGADVAIPAVVADSPAAAAPSVPEGRAVAIG